MRRPQPPRPPRPRQLTPRPVGEAGFGPAEEIAEARAELDAAHAEVEAISQALLDRLLKTGIRKRFRHFDDADLTPAHRQVLRASVVDSEAAPAGLARAAWRGVGRVGAAVLPRPTTLVTAALACGGLAGGIDLLSRHDGEFAQVTAIMPVVRKNADRSPSRGVLGPGVALVVERDGDGLRAREWVPATGYATYLVDPSAVRVGHRSGWQRITAIASVLAAGWHQPGERR